MPYIRVQLIRGLRQKRPDMTVVAITHDPAFEKVSERVIDFEKVNKRQVLGNNQVLEAIAKPN